MSTNSQKPLTVGITGQSGFMGTHLFNYLKLQDGMRLIPFEDGFFEDTPRLEP